MGERVQGWDKSSSRLTEFELTRSGFGAVNSLSWLLAKTALGALDNGGVFRRGTPTNAK